VMADRSTPTASFAWAAEPPSALECAFDHGLTLLSAERRDDLERIRERWQHREFVVVVVGEFKRGKSTLLNALIGEDLLPAGVQPVTAVATRIRSSTRRGATARFLDGHVRAMEPEEARHYIDESRNPKNQLGVLDVEIRLEAGPPEGVVLVDVPGTGSVHSHNTAAALAALPEADVALVVASVDPPIGEAEVRLLETMRTHAARIEVVLNKVDYLDEAGRAAALAFTRSVLAQQGMGAVDVWPLSARDGLQARITDDHAGWRRSGMEPLTSRLRRVFEDERGALLARSLAKKAGRLVDQELALVEMQQAAAERSARELRQIIAAFRAWRANADRDALEAELILRKRFDRLFDGYPDRAAEAWKPHRAALESRLQQLLSTHGGQSRSWIWKAMESAVRESVDVFMHSFFEVAGRQLAGSYERLCAEVSQAASERARAVWRSAADLLPFDVPEVEPPATAPTPRPLENQVVSLRLLLDDLEDAAAWLLPRAAALRRLAALARDEAEARYGRAVERSREAFTRVYDDHFRDVMASFEACARRTAEGIEAALAAAEARAKGAEAGGQATASQAQSTQAGLRELRRELASIESEGPLGAAVGGGRP